MENSAAQLVAERPSTESIGLSIGSWNVGTGLLGAPTLHLDLMFDWPSGTVTGRARFTQPVSPPIDIEIVVQGMFAVLHWPNGRSAVVMSLRGHGADPTTAGTEILRLLVELDGQWSHGMAEYSVKIDGKWVRIQAPVKPSSQQISMASDGASGAGGSMPGPIVVTRDQASVTATVGEVIYFSGWEVPDHTHISTTKPEIVELIPAERHPTWVTAPCAKGIKPGEASVTIVPAKEDPNQNQQTVQVTIVPKRIL